jgi:hypothetical protein
MISFHQPDPCCPPAAPSHPKSLLTAARRGIAATLATLTLAAGVQAQPPRLGRFAPLDQNAPPGLAGSWSVVAHPTARNYWQPIRVELPVEAAVTVYDGEKPHALGPDVQASLLVGAVYRLKISDMAEYPGTELYPTVELLDRLHPPAGRVQEFPVPVSLTEQEIQFALEGRIVTKVIYLEQPDRALPVGGPTANRSVISRYMENVISLADERGRPMAIVRLGGRLPSADGTEPEFYGSGAPVVIANPLRQSPETARR